MKDHRGNHLYYTLNELKQLTIDSVDYRIWKLEQNQRY